MATSELEDAPSNWRVFYGTRFTPLHASTYEPPRTCTARPEPFPSLYSCAIGQRADWSDVPFYGHTDEIDECANVKFVDRIELTILRGHDNRPTDEAEHQDLHRRTS